MGLLSPSKARSDTPSFLLLESDLSLVLGEFLARGEEGAGPFVANGAVGGFIDSGEWWMWLGAIAVSRPGNEFMSISLSSHRLGAGLGLMGGVTGEIDPVETGEWARSCSLSSAIESFTLSEDFRVGRSSLDWKPRAVLLRK